MDRVRFNNWRRNSWSRTIINGKKLLCILKKYETHYACMFGNIEMVKLLLDNGSDKNIQNEFGENAVRIAINSSSENKEKIVKLLNNFA